MSKQTQIAFTTDKNGQPLAFRWSMPAGRWFRMGLDEAKLLTATGRARTVPYSK